MDSNKTLHIFAVASLAMLAACTDDPVSPDADGDQEEIPDWVETETYSGGLLGTTFNVSASAFEDPTPAVENAGLVQEFKHGEMIFEHNYGPTSEPFDGLGPLYLRTSCLMCHPGYGHGKRTTSYRYDEMGNGYLLVLYDKQTDAYLTSLTGMPQTQAIEPFKAPLDESQIQINWISYQDEWGNKFPDGETYDLIYPEVIIPESAYYVPIQASRNGETVTLTADEVGIRLESTIGIYGTGLLDAIPDEALKEQYASVEAVEKETGKDLVNDAFFKDGEWVKQYSNTLQGNGEQHPYRFTYALSRGALQDGPGANAIWNITNVTRSDRRYHYMTTAYASTASKDPDVQEGFYHFIETYFPDYTDKWNTGDVEKDIYDFLMSQDLPVEMTDEEYTDLMIWHRGLAVPAARNLSDPQVQRGRELFRQIGCASCHRPSWTTGQDNYNDPNLFFKGTELPRYPEQTIWPYSDMMQHRLYMQNDIRGEWCRTTPLWGRGLSLVCSGHQDRLHDCRARNVIEAIMWHGSSQSDARASVEEFRELSSDDRSAIVEFINSI
ncbi:MAG TPA: hypothetical protein IAC09_09770 [Candidatus Cryptobacteroides intestinipullorum]|nr:hypothetical protein [Candidatus Cryptobacteroides intestinipullorum]